MTAVIVGGDYVNPIKKIITGKGIRRIEHWDGRKKGDIRKTFPKSTGLVILLCDYLNHCLAKKVREDAERLGLPVLYCRRSLGQFTEKLEDLLENGAIALTTEIEAKCCGICGKQGTPTVN